MTVEQECREVLSVYTVLSDHRIIVLLHFPSLKLTLLNSIQLIITLLQDANSNDIIQ